MSEQGWTSVSGIGHVRLTVTDIEVSKAFYRQLLGVDPVIDFSDQVAEPGVRQDPDKFFGGAVFPVGPGQVLGLRPVAAAGERFDSTRVGLDHVSLVVASVDELYAAATRLDQAGVEHGEVVELGLAQMVILSVQDPDDINLELMAATSA